MQAVGDSIQAPGKAVAVNKDNLRQPVAAAFEPIDQRDGTVAEIARQGFACFAKTVGGRITLNADRLDGLDASGTDPVDNILSMFVQGGAEVLRDIP